MQQGKPRRLTEEDRRQYEKLLDEHYSQPSKNGDDKERWERDVADEMERQLREN